MRLVPGLAADIYLKTSNGSTQNMLVIMATDRR